MDGAVVDNVPQSIGPDDHIVNPPRWWKEGLIYQIWPMSYKDSNGDGIGDLNGITSTLNYLKDLGVDTIWLSPMYNSPQNDYGYDISDYEAIYPPYGTMEDMDRLIAECRARDMRIILDLVVNHTSDEHKWFQESRKSRDNPYADWYIWKDPKMIDGVRHPPNNWASILGGSGWEYVKERNQYYFHAFVKGQPDLNWENPETRKAIHKSAIEFWLKKGVSGFRVDVASGFAKDQRFLDAAITVPENQYQFPGEFMFNLPRVHDYFKEIRKDVLDPYGDVVMIGEAISLTGGKDLIPYILKENHELDCLIDWGVLSLGGRMSSPPHQVYRPRLPEIKIGWKASQDMRVDIDAWITTYLENHDQSRSVSRFGTEDPRWRAQAAKVLATLLCCSSGTLLLYQGQEIGMTNHPTSWGIEEIKDPFAIIAYEDMRKKYGDKKLWLDKAMKGIQNIGRDNARTPVQWAARPHGGFTTGQPWMRVNDNYSEINVEQQLHDKDSVLEYWRRLLAVRMRNRKTMLYGNFEITDVGDPDTFTFYKSSSDNKEHLVVYLNFSDEAQPLELPPFIQKRGVRSLRDMELLIANVDEKTLGEDLGPWEARVYLVR